MPPIENTTVKVNGTEHTSNASVDTPLLYVLRNDLNLKGTRFGCGDGLCGACTVLIDGKPRTACDVPLWEAAGKDILTIEGASEDGRRSAIIEEIIAVQAGQCGYCLPGIVMQAQALLRDNQHPSRVEIASALDKNLCRCGAHVRIVRAIERAAQKLAGAST